MRADVTSLGYLSLTPISFDIFHYKHIPILEWSPSIQALHQSSRLLFWTIIIVACRHHPTHAHLLETLQESYERLLQSAICKAMHSVQTVQAVLIICLWPMPRLHQSEDPSWMFCGLAMNSALHLRLNEPTIPQQLADYDHSNAGKISVRSRTMTWLACFQISTW